MSVAIDVGSKKIPQISKKIEAERYHFEGTTLKEKEVFFKSVLIPHHYTSAVESARSGCGEENQPLMILTDTTHTTPGYVSGVRVAGITGVDPIMTLWYVVLSRHRSAPRENVVARPWDCESAAARARSDWWWGEESR